MKPFTLFFGSSGQLSTYNATDNPQFALVVNTVKNLHDRLLKEELLCQPFLHIFSTCYNDNANFPHNLESSTPVTDQVSKIQNIGDHPPTDTDVVNFLTNSFPDLFLAPSEFGLEGVSRDETWSGGGEADKDKIMINCRFVQLWLHIAHTPMVVGPSRLSLMFIAVFLHELGHSALVWYGKEVCESLQLGGIERESGDYIEKAFLGGMTCAKFELEPMHLVEIGMKKDELFYLIDDRLATKFLAFDTSKGLPLLDISTLPPAPPATVGCIHAKFSWAMGTITQHRVLPAPKPLSATRARPLLKNDKKRILPSV